MASDSELMMRATLRDDASGSANETITIIASFGLKVVGLPICSILTAKRMTDYAHSKRTRMRLSYLLRCSSREAGHSEIFQKRN
jgi:hypothetical protein